MYLIQDFTIEYIINSYKSIIKKDKQFNFFKGQAI